MANKKIPAKGGFLPRRLAGALGGKKIKAKNRKRAIDITAKDIMTWHSDSLVAISKKKVFTWKVFFVFFFVIGILAASVVSIFLNIESRSKAEVENIMIEKMKKKGCVADGLLSGYGTDTDNLIEMINRSECQYLHRAVETWASPPDFDAVEKNIQKIKKSDLVIGMFLAEAINPKKKYKDKETGKEFDFSKMCKAGSMGMWGDNTCKADMDNKDYREYLVDVSEKAIDLGITSFLFGQIYMQEGADLSDSKIPDVIKEIRKYAKKKDIQIVIGAQTNTISNEKYLKNFDYIEGGVGQTPSGKIDEGPCDKYYGERRGGWCWALLWNKLFSERANNVILHLDWSGADDDDMSVFSRMTQEDRIRTLYKFHKQFNAKNMGFLMPFLAVINPKNPLCFGPTKEFYAPDNKYTCKDEDDMNAILKGTFIGNDAKFVSRKIPEKMEAGKKYAISVTYLNSGKFGWSQKNNYRLGAQNPADNVFWGLNRTDLEKDEFIEKGKTKTFNFEVTAPGKAGTFTMDWQMVNEEIEWFGEKTPTATVVVSAP
jgi:hypothetical protein